MKSGEEAEKRVSHSVLALSPEQVAALLKNGQLTASILGLGRIGLPTATLFADSGVLVTGVDIDERVVKQTNLGECKLTDEPGLDEILKKNVAEKRFDATSEAGPAVASSDFIIICVPTPVDAMKSPNYGAVRAACRTVGRSLSKGSIVIVESTVGPGVVEDMLGPILEEESGMKVGIDFGLASCPERSDPGSIMKNMRSVPRIVGSSDPHCSDLVATFYEQGLGVKIVRVSSAKTANAVKLTENLFRDVNIALANEFALLYEKFGIDTVEVIDACATKYNFMPHYPGIGVGGPCLPSNPYYLIVEGLRVGNIPYLIRLAREINDRMPDHVVELASEALNDVGKTVRGARVAILGVAYKPGVRDVQLTPLEEVIKKLTQMGALIEIYDPMYAGDEVMNFHVHPSIESALTAADCVIFGTAHKEFKNLDLASLAKLMKAKPAMVDGRNVVRAEQARDAGFAFRGVGRVSKPS